jgi:hypothetical protein
LKMLEKLQYCDGSYVGVLKPISKCEKRNWKSIELRKNQIWEGVRKRRQSWGTRPKQGTWGRKDCWSHQVCWEAIRALEGSANTKRNLSRSPGW